MEDESRATGSSNFGTLLRRYRQAAGLSQEALAERARMSTNGIGALERGDRRSPQRQTLELLVGALALDNEQRREFEMAAIRPSSPRRATETVGFWPSTAAALPLALSSFVGREVELDEISTLVREHRLVTLTGAGGVGKTQTALQVARTLSESTEERAYFIGLAQSGPSPVVAAIASALGVQEVPGRPLLESLLANLENKSILLVLDNCEHVIESSANTANALLLGCPRIRILATSREPLKVSGEFAYRLPSLDRSSAVVLFADRARAVDHRFTLVDENESIVSEICRRLDGIPLAIELAAARINVMSPETLVQKINDRFRLFAGGARMLLARQQTMHATIEWSYSLLSERERRTFERLSVFAGGCSLGMAFSVCADEREGETEILALLSSLVDKSLLAADVCADETRYLLLETTRQYARERLVEREEFEAISHRHALALLALARELAETQTIYNARLDWSPKALRTKRAERANFEEALQWTLERRQNPRLGQELAWRVPFLRATDARRWLSLALEAVDQDTPRALIVNLEIQLGWCLVDLRCHENAIVIARRAVASSRVAGEPRLVGAARRLLGRVLTHAWKLDEAELELQHALTSLRGFGDRHAIATTLSYLAFVAFRRGLYVKARRLNLEAVEALGDDDERHARLIKIELARAEFGLGNHEVALAYSREVLPSLEAEAAEGGATCVILMLNQCTFLLALGRFDEAMEVGMRALIATLDTQNPRPDLVPYVAGMLAKVAVLSPGQERGAERTELLQKCAELIAWNEAVCAARGESDPDETFEELSILRRELGAERAEALLVRGSGLNLGKAIELMQSLAPASAMAAGTTGEVDHN